MIGNTTSLPMGRKEGITSLWFSSRTLLRSVLETANHDQAGNVFPSMQGMILSAGGLCFGTFLRQGSTREKHITDNIHSPYDTRINGRGNKKMRSVVLSSVSSSWLVAQERRWGCVNIRQVIYHEKAR